MFVVGAPEWLEIGMVVADVNVVFARKVEGGAWDDVIDMPAAAPVVGPGHAGAELAFEVCGEFCWGASEVLQDGIAFCGRTDAHVIAEALVEANADAAFWIGEFARIVFFAAGAFGASLRAVNLIFGTGDWHVPRALLAFAWSVSEVGVHRPARAVQTRMVFPFAP